MFLQKCLKIFSNTKLIYTGLVVSTILVCFLFIRSQNGRDLKEIWRQNNLKATQSEEQAGNSSCPMVLRGGRFVVNNRWAPYGCTLHNYTYGYTQQCIQVDKKNGSRDHIVFMGDSRIRDIFDDWKMLFVRNATVRKSQDYQRYETDFAIIEFFWRSTIDQVLSALQALSFLPRKQRPGFVLAGCAAHDIVRGKATLKALLNYKEQLMALQPYLTELQYTTTLIWMIQPRLNVTAYRIRKLYNPAYCVLTNEQIDLYNIVAKETLKSSPFQLWTTGRDVAARFIEDMKDGIHVGPRANYWNVQILMNVFCNQRLRNIQASCCKHPERHTLQHLI